MKEVEYYIYNHYSGQFWNYRLYRRIRGNNYFKSASGYDYGFSSELWNGNAWEKCEASWHRQHVTLEELSKLLSDNWDRIEFDERKYWNSLDVWGELLIGDATEEDILKNVNNVTRRVLDKNKNSGNVSIEEVRARKYIRDAMNGRSTLITVRGEDGSEIGKAVINAHNYGAMKKIKINSDAGPIEIYLLNYLFGSPFHYVD